MTAKNYKKHLYTKLKQLINKRFNSKKLSNMLSQLTKEPSLNKELLRNLFNHVFSLKVELSNMDVFAITDNAIELILNQKKWIEVMELVKTYFHQQYPENDYSIDIDFNNGIVSISYKQLGTSIYMLFKENDKPYSTIQDTNNGYIIGDGNKFFHLDKNGDRRYFVEYDDVQPFYQDRAVVSLNRKEFHILYNGDPAYDEKYDKVGSFDSNKMAFVIDDGEEFFIDLAGCKILEE